ncbi:MAG: RsmF rRNA methyltransferase first C-terminal domain-containing protein [Eubacteriales bacterium]|nr:RsmF rRNA methyltransferase first C-terminal domain-containing protein [Eubacteriales bacterium]
MHIKKALNLYNDFEKDNLNITFFNEKYDIINFSDNLYYINKEYLHFLNQNMQILRFCLKLGIIKKDRFEPSYALSHYLNINNVKRYTNLSEEVLKKYLNGQVLKEKEEYEIISNESIESNAWILVCFKSIPISFSKNVNGVLKNFHPKGLRLC